VPPRRRGPRPVQEELFEIGRGLFAQEQPLWARGLHVAGVDEAGRGPLAGPVVAAAVVLDPARPVDGLRDSKLLTPLARRRLARELRERALAWAVCRAGPSRIDAEDILGATWYVMRRALARLSVAPALVLIDGRLRVPGLRLPQRAIVKADRRCGSVAAASILAKVARDAYMIRADLRFPGYGFRVHKGYGTAAHLEALTRLGPSPLHRRSFHGVVRVLGIGPMLLPGFPVEPEPPAP